MKKEHIESVFRETLSEMDYEFSGIAFAKKSRDKGLPKFVFQTGLNTKFLHENAYQITHKMWTKHTPPNRCVLRETYQQSEVDEMIQSLKNLGYKIYKNQLVEL